MSTKNLQTRHFRTKKSASDRVKTAGKFLHIGLQPQHPARRILLQRLLEINKLLAALRLDFLGNVDRLAKELANAHKIRLQQTARRHRWRADAQTVRV